MKILVLSGAGLSAESGLSTFRGSTGLWCGHDVNKVANGRTWRANYELVRSFYNQRRGEIGRAQPNDGHRLIAALADRHTVVHFTQNVDDLAERAADPSVIHLHGFGREMRCATCGRIWDVGYAEVTETTCPFCGAHRGVRPNIVFFGEAAPNYGLLHHAIEQLRPEDVVLVVGTSGQVLNLDMLFGEAPGLKILCNLEPSPAIAPDLFDLEFYQPITAAAGSIRDAVEAHGGSAAARHPTGGWYAGQLLDLLDLAYS